jgi:hypothetical protein
MKQKPFSKDPASGLGVPNCTASPEYFLRQRAQTRPKLRQRSLQPSAPQGIKSQLRWRNAPKEHTQNHMQKARASGGRGFRTSLITFYSFLPFAQRLAPQILRRSPPSCPGRNDSSAIMARRHLCQIAYKKFCEIIRKVSGRPAGWGRAEERIGSSLLLF